MDWSLDNIFNTICISNTEGMGTDLKMAVERTDRCIQICCQYLEIVT
jgi:hypothetical protein